MRLLVFLHGTTVMHASGVGRTRGERVAQVVDGTDPSIRDYGGYLPIGDAARKLAGWREEGAEIAYLSSHRRPEDVAHDVAVLERRGFPLGHVLSRGAGESYGDVLARELPDVLIEDDCESIGAAEMAHAQAPPPVRDRVVAVIVPEFGGIDHLPDRLDELVGYATSATSIPK